MAEPATTLTNSNTDVKHRHDTHAHTHTHTHVDTYTCGHTHTYFSVTSSKLVHMYALNSGSALSRNARISFTMLRILLLSIKANESSSDRRWRDMSFSLRQSRMVFLCLCTALLSILTVLSSVLRAT